MIRVLALVALCFGCTVTLAVNSPPAAPAIAAAPQPAPAAAPAPVPPINPRLPYATVGPDGKVTPRPDLTPEEKALLVADLKKQGIAVPPDLEPPKPAPSLPPKPETKKPPPPK